MDKPDYFRRDDFDEQQYESLIQAGIAAVKAKDYEQGISLLLKATQMKPGDARPWIWLSATTSDPQEQRNYLGYALAIDPNNSAARQGLVLLSEKLDKSLLMKEGEAIESQPSQEPEMVAGKQVFSCSKCGGHMYFNLQQQLVCEFCGYTEEVTKNHTADEEEQVLDFVLPTVQGHQWSDIQQQMVCSQCGAVSLLSQNVMATECPYCGSHQLLTSPKASQLIDPNVIAPAKLNEKEIADKFRVWLGKGWFAPDDLRRLAQSSALRPAYYPFWTFDGTLHLSWTCEVNEGTSKYPHWVPRSGVELEMFDDVLVPGIKALMKESISPLGPFHLKELAEFNPSYIAGWTALAYDHPLADASLVARQLVVRRVRSQLYNRLQISQSKRKLKSNGTNWSGMTFKLVLLPLWSGSYRYQGKDYRILINGCNGNVAGQKPTDMVKVWLAVISAIILLVLIGVLIAELLR